MAISIAIADVLTQVQFRLHLPAVGSGTFVTSGSALALAKSSVSRLGAMLNRSFGDNYFAQTATLSTQAGVDLVSLPASFKDLLSLHWVDGDRAELLERAEITEYDPLPRAWSRASGAPRYRLEGNVVVLTPPPSEVYTLRCAYTTGLSITSLADTIQANAGCDEWLVLDICEMIRDREDKDASRFTVRKMQIEADLRSQAVRRDRSGVSQVRDVQGIDDESRLSDRRLFGWY